MLYLSNALKEGDLSDWISLFCEHQVELVDLTVCLEDAVDETIKTCPQGSFP